MKIEQLLPKPDTKVKFSLSDFKLVPSKSGCYVLTTFEGDILYVGMSVNLYDRFQQHLDSKEKTSPTTQGRACWFYFLQYDDKNLPYLERTWLNQVEIAQGAYPILNKCASPV